LRFMVKWIASTRCPPTPDVLTSSALVLPHKTCLLGYQGDTLLHQFACNSHVRSTIKSAWIAFETLAKGRRATVRTRRCCLTEENWVSRSVRSRASISVMTLSNSTAWKGNFLGRLKSFNVAAIDSWSYEEEAPLDASVSITFLTDVDGSGANANTDGEDKDTWTDRFKSKLVFFRRQQAHSLPRGWLPPLDAVKRSWACWEVSC
jgi:hypothetical protein